MTFAAAPAAPQDHTLIAGMRSIKTSYSYSTLVQRVGKAVTRNRMGIVNRASVTLGAKRVLGKTIPGNMVIGVFHPRFAVRMLKASIPAGIEAPLRLYITENADKTATLTYRTPSSVFAPYGNAVLDAMAQELDGIFAAIAGDAAAPDAPN